MIDHGQHQRLWEALVVLASTHTPDAPCNDAHCPTVQAVVHEQRALVDASAADPMAAVRAMIAWATPALADTLTANARTAASDAGGETVATLALAAQTPIATMAGQLLIAHLEADHAAVEVLTRLACRHPSVAAEIAAEQIRQLAGALVVRHQQLSATGAHP